MTTPTTDHLIACAPRDDADFMRVRDFLMTAFRHEYWDHNWEIRRWEGWRFYHFADEEANGDHPWTQRVRLWETADGTLIGVAHPEGDGIAFHEVRPGWQTLELEDAMAAWAEDHLAITLEDGRRRLYYDVSDYDTVRQEALLRCGYERLDNYGYNRRRSLDVPIPDVEIPEGYTIRGQRPNDDEDRARLVKALDVVFPRVQTTTVNYRVFETVSPSYRCDLHLMAVAPDGNCAAFCGITWDPVNRQGIFEPVGTVDEYRQKRLGQALMAEGLRRLKALGATHAIVGTGDMEAANRLYESLGFTEYHVDHLWQKVW